MNVLAVVAHPDDEVIGVGGTLARHVMQHDQVSVIIVCENYSLRKNVEKEEMKRQTAHAMQYLGVQDFLCLNYDDQQLEHVNFQELIEEIGDGYEQADPDLVYTHWSEDLNRDHRIVSEVVRVLSRPTAKRVTLLEFPTLSSSENNGKSFPADTWMELQREHMNKKLAAFSCYESEKQEWPFPRNSHGLMAQAEFYGCQVGRDMAEVFRTVRRIY